MDEFDSLIEEPTFDDLIETDPVKPGQSAFTPETTQVSSSLGQTPQEIPMDLQMQGPTARKYGMDFDPNMYISDDLPALASLEEPDNGVAQEEVKEKVHQDYFVSEEKQRAIDESAKRQPTIGQGSLSKEPPRIDPDLLGPNVKAGEYLMDKLSNESLIGKASILLTGTILAGVHGGDPLEYYRDIYDANNKTIMSYKPNELQDMATGSLAVILDLPIFQGTGALYNSASANAIKYSTSYVSDQMVKAGMTRSLADSYAKNSVVRLNSMLQSGTVLGTHSGLNDTATQLAEGADLGEVNWSQSLEAGMHSAELGFSVGAFGVGANYFRSTPQFQRMIDGAVNSRLIHGGYAAASFGGEVSIFTYGDALLSGNKPSSVTAKDLIHGATTIGSLKAMHARQQLPKSKGMFNSVETDAIKNHVTEVRGEDLLKSLVEKEGAGEAFLNDPKVPYSAKAKVAELTETKYDMPLVSKATIVEDANGVRIETRTKDGMLVESQPYASKAEAIRTLSNLEVGVAEMDKAMEMSRMTTENQVEFDRRLEKAGVENGIANEQMIDAVQQLPNQRTAEQKKLANKAFEVYDNLKAEKTEVKEGEAPQEFLKKEEPVVDPVIKADEVIPAVKENLTKYTPQEIEMKFEADDRLQAKINHPRNGIDKMLTDLQAIRESGDFKNASISSKTLRNYFPEAKTDRIAIKTEADLKQAETVLKDSKKAVETELARRTKAGEPKVAEGNFVMGRQAFETREELFKELDKFDSLEGTLPEVIDFDTMMAISDYETAKKSKPTLAARDMKNFANTLRESKGALKPEPGELRVSLPYMDKAYDIGVEVAARAIETGASLVEAVGKAVESIRAQTFYDRLSAIEKQRLEKVVLAKLNDKLNTQTEAMKVERESFIPIEKIDKQVEEHKANEGSTFSAKGENLVGTDAGFVSIFPERSEIFDGELTSARLAEYVGKNSDILKGSEDVLAVGTWYDKESGKTYLDISSAIPIDKAVEFGKKYNQKSIFDLKELKEIDTGGDGEAVAGLASEAQRITALRKAAGLTKPPKKAGQTKIDIELTTPSVRVVDKGRDVSYRMGTEHYERKKDVYEADDGSTWFSIEQRPEKQEVAATIARLFAPVPEVTPVKIGRKGKGYAVKDAATALKNGTEADFLSDQYLLEKLLKDQDRSNNSNHTKGDKGYSFFDFGNADLKDPNVRGITTNEGFGEVLRIEDVIDAYKVEGRDAVKELGDKIGSFKEKLNDPVFKSTIEKMIERSGLDENASNIIETVNKRADAILNHLGIDIAKLTKPPKTSTQKKIDAEVEGKHKVNKVVVQEYTGLKEQIRGQAKIAKDIDKFRKEAQAEIQKFIGTADFQKNMGARTTKTIARRVAGMDVNNPKSVDEVMDYIDRAITDAKFSQELASIDKAYDTLDKQTSPESMQRKENGVAKGKGIDPKYQDKLKSTRKSMLEKDWGKAQEEIDRLQENMETMSEGWDEAVLAKIEDLSFHGLLNETSRPSLAELKSRIADIESIRKQGRTLGAAKRMIRAAERAERIKGSFDVLNAGKRKVELDPEKIANLKTPIHRKASRWLDWSNLDSWWTLLDKMSRFDKSSTMFNSYLSRSNSEPVLAAERGEFLGTEKQHSIVNDKIAEIYGETNPNKLKKIIDKNTTELHIMKWESEGINKISKSETLDITMSQAYKRWMELQDPTLKPSLTKQGYFDQLGERTSKYDALEEVLTPEAKKWAEWQLNEFYPAYHESINEVYRDIYGTDMPLHDKYSPIFVADKVLSADAAVDQMFGTNDVRGMAGNNHIKLRTGHAKELLMLDGDKVLMNYINKMEFFKNWAQPLRDLNSVFNDRGVKESIRQNFGQDYVDVVDHFLSKAARDPKKLNKFEKASNTLRTNFTLGSLAIKPTVFAKQITSFPAFADRIPVAQFAKGMADWANPAGWGKVTKLLNDSPYLKERYKKGWDRDVALAMQRDAQAMLAGKNSGNFKNGMMFLTKYGDKAAIMFGGWPVYKYHRDQALKNGMSADAAHEAGLRNFEFATRQSQQATGPMDLSVIQNSNPIMKWATMYKTSPLQYHRKVISAARDLAIDHRNPMESAKTMLIYHAVLPQLFQLVGNGFQWDGEDQLRALKWGSATGVPMAGDALRGMYNHLTDTGFDYQPTVLSDLFKESGRAVDEIIDIASGDLGPIDEITFDDIVESINHLAKASGSWTGTPTDAVQNTMSGVADAMSGETSFPARRILGWSEYALDDDRYDLLRDLPADVMKRINGNLSNEKKSWSDLTEDEGNPTTWDDLIDD